jgi:thioredoxin reductase (NADPH)
MFGAEVAAAHGDTSLEAIDVRDSATGGTSRLESGGLFLFIGADAETAWLPPEIALDRNGYVLTGSDLPSAKRRTRDGIPGSRGALGSVRRRSVPGLEA